MRQKEKAHRYITHTFLSVLEVFKCEHVVVGGDGCAGRALDEEESGYCFFREYLLLLSHHICCFFWDVNQRNLSQGMTQCADS